MRKVEIYTKTYCPYCQRAKALLDEKGVDYREYEISTNEELQHEMRVRSSRATVPQVFINNVHIGGSDDLLEAQANGSLDELLRVKQAVTA